MSINNIPKIKLPKSIIDFHLTVFLAVDYMIIQCIPFMHSISNNIKFRTVESINGKKPYKKDILGAIGRVLNLYKTRAFQVKQINGDNDFMCISNEALHVQMNIVAADEHVGEVERSIRTIKDGTRYHVYRFSYKKYPRQMVNGCVEMVLKCLNQLPNKNSVRTNISPSSIVLGTCKPDYEGEKIKLRLSFEAINGSKTLLSST